MIHLRKTLESVLHKVAKLLIIKKYQILVQGGPMRLTKSFVLLFFLSLFVFGGTARAGVLVEPYLGFALGSGDNGGNVDYDYKTVQLGGRLGYQMLGFMGGIDYSLASFDLEREYNDNTPGALGDLSTDKNQLGLFVGYDFPILLRAWATYYVSAKADFSNASINEMSGSGTGLGVGFTGLPFVSLNLEYRSFKYDEAKDNNGTVSGFSERSLNEIFLSVSLPLDL